MLDWTKPLRTKGGPNLPSEPVFMVKPLDSSYTKYHHDSRTHQVWFIPDAPDIYRLYGVDGEIYTYGSDHPLDLENYIPDQDFLSRPREKSIWRPTPIDSCHRAYDSVFYQVINVIDLDDQFNSEPTVVFGRSYYSKANNYSLPLSRWDDLMVPATLDEIIEFKSSLTKGSNK